MKLMVESILLILSIESFNILRSSLKIRSSSWLLNGGIDTLDGSIGLEISVHLRFDLSEILVNILVSSFKSLLGELSNFALHHALLVLKRQSDPPKKQSRVTTFWRKPSLELALFSVFADYWDLMASSIVE
jgi:hypothetical protein